MEAASAQISTFTEVYVQVSDSGQVGSVPDRSGDGFVHLGPSAAVAKPALPRSLPCREALARLAAALGRDGQVQPDLAVSAGGRGRGRFAEGALSRALSRVPVAAPGVAWAIMRLARLPR